MSQTRGTIDTASRPLVPTHAHGAFGPTLIWAAIDDLIPHIGGVVSHRAQVFEEYSSKSNKRFLRRYVGRKSVTWSELTILAK